MCLAFLDRSRRRRLQFLVLSLSAGGVMGIYQVLRGAHFASHIAVTLLMALAIVQLTKIGTTVFAAVPAIDS